jgi:hypothetical protein
MSAVMGNHARRMELRQIAVAAIASLYYDG